MRLETSATKEKVISLRMTEKDFMKIKRKAMLYTRGNVTEYLTYVGINYVPGKDEIKKGSK